MDKNIIKEIFRNLVITWPNIVCSQINTFFIIDDGSEFETENLKATYNDYLKGEFWSRDWVTAGANPETLCKQYPILGIEQKKVLADEIFAKEFCYEYWVVIADKGSCEECNEECNRTKDEVDNDLYKNAILLLNELKKYKEFTVNKNGLTFILWGTAEEMEKYLLSSYIDGYSETGREIYNHIKTDNLNIESIAIGLTDGARAISFPLTFCDCPNEKEEFNYDIQTFKNIATTKCKTC